MPLPIGSGKVIDHRSDAQSEGSLMTPKAHLEQLADHGVHAIQSLLMGYRGKVDVGRGGLDVGMTQILLYLHDGYPVIHQVGGKTVTQGMATDLAQDPSSPHRMGQCIAQPRSTHRLTGLSHAPTHLLHRGRSTTHPWEHPAAVLVAFPVTLKLLVKMRAKDRVMILPSLAAAYKDLVVLASYILGMKVYTLTNA